MSIEARSMTKNSHLSGISKIIIICEIQHYIFEFLLSHHLKPPTAFDEVVETTTVENGHNDDSLS